MLHKNSNDEASQRNPEEEKALLNLRDLHMGLIPKLGEGWNQHSLVTLTRQTLSRILHYDRLYQNILNTPGVILEFGVQWGATISQLAALRGIYEPYNHSRKIFGFDTFLGFTSPDSIKDGKFPKEGMYGTFPRYESYLEQILQIHERESPISHLKKFDLIKGNVSETAQKWSQSHPGTPVAMAIFDMDIYQPTKDALEALIPHFSKGTLLIFDELMAPEFPGEAQALNEVLKTNELKLHQNPHQPNAAWTIWGE